MLICACSIMPVPCRKAFSTKGIKSMGSISALPSCSAAKKFTATFFTKALLLKVYITLNIQPPWITPHAAHLSHITCSALATKALTMMVSSRSDFFRAIATILFKTLNIKCGLTCDRKRQFCFSGFHFPLLHWFVKCNLIQDHTICGARGENKQPGKRIPGQKFTISYSDVFKKKRLKQG